MERERESDRQEDLDSKEEIDGWNWTDPEVEVFIDQGRTKFGFVDGWGKMEGEGGRSLEMGIVEREAIRGGDRDSRQITSG